MANASSTGFGLRATMTLGSTPATQGLSEYPMHSGHSKRFNQNDPTSKQGANDTGYLQDAAHDTMADGLAGGKDWASNTANVLPFAGVWNGCFYIDNTTGKPTFANTVAASTTFGTNYNTGSTDGVGFVNDDPLQEYVVKADAALAISAMVGDLTYNIEDGGTTAKQTSGQSTVKLKVSSAAATGAGQAAFIAIRSANDPENKDLAVADANVIVKFAPGSIGWLA